MQAGRCLVQWGDRRGVRRQLEGPPNQCIEHDAHLAGRHRFASAVRARGRTQRCLDTPEAARRGRRGCRRGRSADARPRRYRRRCLLPPACRMGRAAWLAAALLLAALVTTAADRDLLGGPSAAIVNGETPQAASWQRAGGGRLHAVVAPALPPPPPALDPCHLHLPRLLLQAWMRPGAASATCAHYGTRRRVPTSAEVRAAQPGAGRALSSVSPPLPMDPCRRQQREAGSMGCLRGFLRAPPQQAWHRLCRPPTCMQARSSIPRWC